MTKSDSELMSALVDNELEGKELEQALDLLMSDEEMRLRWQSYQHHSDVLHGQTPAFAVDISSAVSNALEQEPVHQSQSVKSNVISLPQRFWQQTAGLAVAASVGALAMVGFISNQPISPDSSMTVVQQNVEETAPVTAAVVNVAETKSNRWTVAEPELEDRLNDYLVDHHEYVGTSGVFSYARVVSYDSGQ
jgi:sigma-E factor negative regulatory protein RseA